MTARHHPGSWGRIRPGILALSLAALFFGGLTLGFLLSPSRSVTAGEQAPILIPRSAAKVEAQPMASEAEPPVKQSTASSRHTPMVEAVLRVSPSVVSVIVTKRARRAPRSALDLFFSRGPLESRQGLGSGFAIDQDGYILTNHHVVNDADSIVVVDAMGRVYQGELIGSDELIDIAVLKVPADRIPAAPIGTSSDLMVGEPSIAMGNPTGFDVVNTEASVTAGVISGVGRDMRSVRQRETLYADMIQTDAAINPGNSGGPLVNAHGEVVGVNSFIFSRSGGSEGLGFAIPIDRAMRVAGELRKFGRVRHPWVGMEVASVQSDSLFLQSIVRAVAPGSPAGRADISIGDVVLTANGKKIRSPLGWEIVMLDAGVDGQMNLRMHRDGKLRLATLPVEERPSEIAERVEVLRGMELVSVTPQIAAERRLRVTEGALVISVSSAVARATRLRPGDVIVAINQREVRSADDAAELFRYYTGSQGWVRLWIYRQGSTFITRFGIR